MSSTDDGPGTTAATWAAHVGAAGMARLDDDLHVLERVVVLAAHPGDESLGAGGLVARAHSRGLEVVVVVATDGEASLTTTLVELIGDGRRTLLVAPWRRDGHPDREAAGRAAATAAVRTSATLWEYPVRFWHWATPDDAPWPDLGALHLSAAEVLAKAHACAAHGARDGSRRR